ncbi:MAG: hypothetical protein CL916_02190 [Deltaproteobacteria bacterium]|nr:hypothetical protein [Deltaproteobacteria bacterium]
MSTFVHQNLTCHKCGSVFSAPLLKGMHITRIPQVRKTILDGTFQVFPCTYCSYPVQVERSSIYTDFEAGHYIAIEPTGHPNPKEMIHFHQGVFDRCFIMGPSVAEELSHRMQPRLVFGLTALREKLLCWDKGLDDRVLEILKIDLIREKNWDRREVIIRLLGILGPGHLLFACYPRIRIQPSQKHQQVDLPKPEEHITVLKKRYVSFLSRRAHNKDLAPWIYGDWLVDASLGG